MGPLVAFLSSLAATDMSLAVARIKRNAILRAIAGSFFLTAVIFGLIALTIYLSHKLGPIGATLAVGGVFLVFGIITLITMSIMEARDRRIAEERKRKSQVQTNLVMATTMTLFRRKPLMAAGIAMAVGGLLGFTRLGFGGRDDDA
ncbi:hypothetical protein BJF93_23405 [Xaviernesmea oryzae]|uniref:Uncharacterized protein n=1 Tax=Xaviernesmea oryzae TaxID=464029 RepID=A0A1Q9B2U9_9HYPH|nr:hypothetical protein [Xaviernesmea oryzae]OLP62312.1 hypothetical protein BJF93_23405 [Xaviernesmea oryzae]SEL96449.1 hypothetical protein SAMN04487976_11617 [Xaviernesmea oryzae]